MTARVLTARLLVAGLLAGGAPGAMLMAAVPALAADPAPSRNVPETAQRDAANGAAATRPGAASASSRDAAGGTPAAGPADLAPASPRTPPFSAAPGTPPSPAPVTAPGAASALPSPAPATPDGLASTAPHVPAAGAAPVMPGRAPAPVILGATPSAGSLMQTILALTLVLGLLAVLAWFLKRFGGRVTGATANMRVVGALHLGGREKVVVVEIGDQWIVVGAAPGRVSALATLPRQEQGPASLASEAQPASAGNFADWLKQTIDKRHGK